MDVSLLHPTLRAPGLSEAHLLTKPMAFSVGNPDPLNRRPMVAYPRSDTPDLTGAPTRRSCDGSGDIPAADADTMLGAMDLWSAGFRPFTVTESTPTAVEKTVARLDTQDTGPPLATSMAGRSLDRCAMVETLIKSANTSLAWPRAFSKAVVDLRRDQPNSPGAVIRAMQDPLCFRHAARRSPQTARRHRAKPITAELGLEGSVSYSSVAL